MNDLATAPVDAGYRLEDRYTRDSGRVFLTGTQALVRIALDQARRDRAAGLNTAGLVSGYRGSPLGAVDLEMWRSIGLAAANANTACFFASIRSSICGPGRSGQR